MDVSPGGALDRAGVWGELSRRPCLEGSGWSGLESAATGGTSPGAEGRADPGLEEEGVARAKKKALREGRILVFIDESGLSQRPHRCRTWAPRGQTPILQYNFNWKSLSVAAGLTLWNFYFRIYAGAIKKEQVVDFLEALVRHLPLPLLIVWDRLPAHRSRLGQDYIAGLQGWISTAYLPPYAPELNPVEYIWGYWKQHELPNVCPKDYWQLTEAARRSLRRMRRRPRLITAFWQQASLWSE
jgi:transposase